MRSNYQKLHNKEYDELLIENETLETELKRTNSYLLSLEKSIATLTANNDKLLKSNDELLNSIKEKDKIITALTNRISELTILIDKLLKQKNKDSGNSSKPSGTNGSKKVITNRREKSDKKAVGQPGHEGHVLKVKQVEKMLKSGNFEHQVIDNKDIDTTIRYTIDIDFKMVIKENKNYKKGLNPVVYGENIKSLAIYLMTNAYSSTDSVCNFFEVISNDAIRLSKGTLINWLIEFSNKSEVDREIIKSKLISSYYTNNDDSQIKINGENYNQIDCSNNKYTYLTINKHKNANAIESAGILPNFKGVVIKDGASVYSNYGSQCSQCLSHILRYLKGVYEQNKRQEAKDILNYLKLINEERNKLIASNIDCFSEEKIKEIDNEYDLLISKWEDALNKAKINDKDKFYEDEERLLVRMKEKHKEEILYFIHDFKVPSTNNQAEVDQRGIKIKQKIGKFRSVDGAINYANSKSIILTSKKQEINIFKAIKDIFKGEYIFKEAVEN